MKVDSIKHLIKKTYSSMFPGQLIVDSGKSKLSAITFDDGPCPRNTKKIVSILEQCNIKATFFLSGEIAEQYPELIQLIHKQGHQLANHGYYHSKSKEIGINKYIDGVNKTHSLLENIVNSKLQKVFRPPYGEMNLVTVYKLIKQGYQFALWSYDTFDSYLDTPEEILDHLNRNLPRKTEIFLMHEDYDRLTTALPKLIEFLANKGHKFDRLDQIYKE